MYDKPFADLAPNRQFDLLNRAACRYTMALAEADEGEAQCWADVIRSMLDHPEWPPPAVYTTRGEHTGKVFP